MWNKLQSLYHCKIKRLIHGIKRVVYSPSAIILLLLIVVAYLISWGIRPEQIVAGGGVVAAIIQGMWNGNRIAAIQQQNIDQQGLIEWLQDQNVQLTEEISELKTAIDGMTDTHKVEIGRERHVAHFLRGLLNSFWLTIIHDHEVMANAGLPVHDIDFDPSNPLKGMPEFDVEKHPAQMTRQKITPYGRPA